MIYMEREIHNRPWGYYEILAVNDYSQTKEIRVLPNEKLSLQSHHRREESWTVTNGVGTVQLGDEIIEIKKGSTLYIPRECKHRLTNTDPKETLVVIEVQLGDYFGEDDIVRYDDVYGRV